MMHDKGIVNQEIDEAYKIMDRLGFISSDAVHQHVSDPHGWKDPYTSFNGMSLDSFIRMIYIGHVVEITREEKVKDLYDSYSGQGDFGGHVTTAMRKTLDIMRLKIKGVND